MSDRKNQIGEITWQQNYYACGIVVMPGGRFLFSQRSVSEKIQVLCGIVMAAQ
jgi:hypothetical protein